MVSYRVIGKPIPTDVDGKATGATRFTADVRLPGLLWGKVLRSPFSHARIKRIDTSKAERLPGVHAVLTGDDVRGIRYGRRYKDVPVLAQGVVRYIGERVAAVAAEDAATATAAAALIEVEYEELPAVFDPLEAMRDDAPLLHPDVNSYEGLPEPVEPLSNVFVRDVTTKGDVEAGFATSDVVVENEFTVARTHQAYMEPHACV
ncbi:MAG: molybdopterin-dependent oxidoreductase, partial [Chloroflexi bacterium]|nr:molybdopterin-dependent oxidoreductase [Chloroflexota bacterium]